MIKRLLLGATAIVVWGVATPAGATCAAFTQISNNTPADATVVMSNFQAELAGPCFTGYVGVGTTSPTATLHTAGPSATTGLSSTPGLRVGANGSGAFVDVGTYTGGNPFIQGNSAGTGNTQQNLTIEPFGGNVGLGTFTPAARLDVVGGVNASSGYSQNSDIRLKADIASLGPETLDQVMQLRPVSFVWKTPDDRMMEGRQLGFIAQEVEKILPSTVVTQNDAARTKGIKYNELIPVLTRALQELKERDDAQARQIHDLLGANHKQASEIRRLGALDQRAAAVLDRLNRRLALLERRAAIRLSANSAR